MDKLCATCGKQLQPDQGFCDNCGAAWMPAGPASAAPPGVTPVAAAPASKSGAGSILLLVAVAVVALGIGGWFLVSRRPWMSSSSSTMMTTSRVASTTSAAAAVVPAPAVPAPVASGGTPATVAAATEAAASSKPCSLLTRAEMETILGAKIVKVTTNELSCAYFTDETMSAQVETKWSGGREAIAEAKGFNSGPGLFEPVAGIGDEAYMQAAGVLHVLKGDTYVMVNSREYANDSGGSHLEMESAIARKALEKLK